MTYFFIVTLNGLTLAALYFLAASGFTLIFGLMRTVNMAHGALLLLGGYVGFSVVDTTGSWALGLIGGGLAAAFAGLAGALLAHAFFYITPETFGMSESIRLLLMIVVGGLGTIHGAVFGAFFIVLLPTVLSWVKVVLPTTIASSSGFDSLAFGIILLVFILFEPDGLYGRWQKIHHYLDVFPMYKRRSFQRQKSFLKTGRLK